MTETVSSDGKKRPKVEIEIEFDTPKKNVEILDDLTAAERAASIARTQANEAVEALRQGDLMQAESFDKSASRDDRMIALLCYLFPLVMSAIVLISESSKGRPFQRYHAVQGLGLTAALGILGIGIGIFSSILWVIPVIGWIVGGVLFCLSPIGFAMGVLAHIYYGYQAYQGKRFSIPGVASFMRSKGWL